ncbi:hypothetical protein [Actibacterium sp. D379-3]
MQRLISMVRRVAGLVGVAVLSACASSDDLAEPPVPLGDFAMGYNIVVADNAEVIPPSRKATPEEWEAALKKQIGLRFGRYEGEKLYHIAVSVDGFALAIPGIPVLVSPKSALVMSVNIWDDAAGAKLTEKPKQMTVLESVTGGTVIGSGYTKSREEQMENLAQNAAKQIERWMVENRAAWFGEMAELPEGEEGVIPPEGAAAQPDEIAAIGPEDTGAPALAETTN